MPNEIWLAAVAIAVIVGLAIFSMVHSSMHQKKLNLLREGVFMTGIRFVFREVGGIMTVLTTMEYQRALARKVARPTWNREFWIQGTWTFVRNPDDLRDYHTATVEALYKVVVDNAAMATGLNYKGLCFEDLEFVVGGIMSAEDSLAIPTRPAPDESAKKTDPHGTGTFSAFQREMMTLASVTSSYRSSSVFGDDAA